jgi:hypothetical protein
MVAARASTHVPSRPARWTDRPDEVCRVTGGWIEICDRRQRQSVGSGVIMLVLATQPAFGDRCSVDGGSMGSSPDVSCLRAWITVALGRWVATVFGEPARARRRMMSCSFWVGLQLRELAGYRAAASIL